MDLMTNNFDLIGDAKDINVETALYSASHKSILEDIIQPNFEPLSQESSSEIPPDVRNVKLTLNRINHRLLQDYLNAQDTKSTALDLRYHLLMIELDEVRQSREQNESHLFVFDQSEINLLPLTCDVTKRPSLRFFGPESKKSLQKRNFKRRFHERRAARQLLLDKGQNHVIKKSRSKNNKVKTESQLQDHSQGIFNGQDDATAVKQEEERLNEVSSIKVEVVLEGNESNHCKTIPLENTNEDIESIIKSDVNPTRRRRGRPRKTKSYEDNLEKLCCDECSFIGESLEAVLKHKNDIHVENSLSEILQSVKDEVNEDEDEDWTADLAYDPTFLDIPDESLFLEPIPKKRKKFSCDKCSYKTDSEVMLDSHKDAKHSAKQSLLDIMHCSYCDQEIERKKMEQHIYTKHKEIKMHICDQCPFKTNSLVNLTRHIDNMHLAINTHPCPECPLQCGSPHALRKHIDRIHKNIQNYMCELCSYRTSTGSELRTHMEMKHTATDRFKCDKCEFATALKRNLERHHIRVHSHIKPFSCPMQGCGYQATEKGDIDKHVRRVHMGMRRYQCHVPRCEFKIDSKSKWLEHLAMEHRLSQQEIDDISLKRKRTRIGGAHRKAALLQSAPVTTLSTSSPGYTPIVDTTTSTSAS